MGGEKKEIQDNKYHNHKIKFSVELVFLLNFLKDTISNYWIRI